MSMEFIKILGDIIKEQEIDPSDPSAQVGGGSSQSSSNSGGWSEEPSYSWTDGGKIASPLTNPGKCNNYHQYRPDRTYKYHNACDISTKEGTPVFAPHDGVFSYEQNSTCGNMVKIKGNDSEGNKVETKFCHLSSVNLPSPAMMVQKGDYIGDTGGTKGYPGSGRSGGAHLHWEFYVNGRATNPYTYN